MTEVFLVLVDVTEIIFWKERKYLLRLSFVSGTLLSTTKLFAYSISYGIPIKQVLPVLLYDEDSYFSCVM